MAGVILDDSDVNGPWITLNCSRYFHHPTSDATRRDTTGFPLAHEPDCCGCTKVCRLRSGSLGVTYPLLAQRKQPCLPSPGGAAHTQVTQASGSPVPRSIDSGFACLSLYGKGWRRGVEDSWFALFVCGARAPQAVLKGLLKSSKAFSVYWLWTKRTPKAL